MTGPALPASLVDLLGRRAERDPDTAYFHVYDETVTYGRLWRESARYAAGLSVAGAATVSTGVGRSGAGAAVASPAFTDGSGGSATAAVLAERISASEKGTRVLCDFLVIAGLLEKEGGEYRSSPDAAFFLDENSPAYFGTVGQFMLDDGLVSCFADVAALARKGGTLLDGQGTVEPDNPLWVDFARSMVPLMMP